MAEAIRNFVNNNWLLITYISCIAAFACQVMSGIKNDESRCNGGDDHRGNDHASIEPGNVPESKRDNC